MAKAKNTSTKSGKEAIRTIVYVHGIGNKPAEDELKCAWDTALFGHEMGERTRMAYWVDRNRYPEPEAGSCRTADIVRDSRRGLVAASLGTGNVEEFIEQLTSDPLEQKILREVAKEAGIGSTGQGNASATGLWTPVSWLFTRVFLRDVHDFLFDDEKRERMSESLQSRLLVGGPFVVIGHSQGSMIAFHVLRRLESEGVRVPLFITIGSPLGLAAVQDRMRDLGGKLVVPHCVDAWLNVADPKDRVALDGDLSDDYKPRGGVAVEDVSARNTDSPEHPHSGTGYLKTRAVRDTVRDVIEPSFAQPTFNMSIAVDLNRAASRVPEQKQEVLIEIDLNNPLPREEAMAAIKASVLSIAPEAKVDELERYVLAHMTRSELEALREYSPALPMYRMWRDSEKKKLAYVNGDATQTAAGRVSYRASGIGIRWAVLDTGIWAKHPHFDKHKNIEAVFDATNGGPITPVPLADAFDRDGHGTHVAALIAGQLDLPSGEEMCGAAPEAELRVYKVLDDGGTGRDSWIIRALDHIASTNAGRAQPVIHGVNLSLGGAFDVSSCACGDSPICKELRRLWRQGVVVVIAAGNDGRAVISSEEGNFETNLPISINDPANLEEAIAVGSVHKTKPHVHGVSWFSSRGPTADGRFKPDVVAPGERILSAAALTKLPRYKKDLTLDKLYVEMSGTSMAAPVVSGLLAAFLSANTEFIGHPDMVKRRLLASCVDLGRDRYSQGAGMPSLMRMMSLV
jgi:subtilisin family serine protease